MYFLTPDKFEISIKLRNGKKKYIDLSLIDWTEIKENCSFDGNEFIFL